MPNRTTVEQREALLERIRGSRERAESRARRLKARDARLIYANLTLGAISTVVAGLAAAFGPNLGIAGEDWRILCAAVALCSAGAALSSGLRQNLSTSDALATAVGCASKLNALEIGLTLSGRDPVEVAREYELVVAGCQDAIM